MRDEKFSIGGALLVFGLIILGLLLGEYFAPTPAPTAAPVTPADIPVSIVHREV